VVNHVVTREGGVIVLDDVAQDKLDTILARCGYHRTFDGLLWYKPQVEYVCLNKQRDGYVRCDADGRVLSSPEVPSDPASSEPLVRT
jgi:hypothetical protein